MPVCKYFAQTLLYPQEVYFLAGYGGSSIPHLDRIFEIVLSTTPNYEWFVFKGDNEPYPELGPFHPPVVYIVDEKDNVQEIVLDCRIRNIISTRILAVIKKHIIIKRKQLTIIQKLGVCVNMDEELC